MTTLWEEARRVSAVQGESAITKGTPVVYFLRLRSGAGYIGASIDLEQRLHDHGTGQACRTTFINPPIELLRVEILESFSTARRREAQLKRWSRDKKEALILGELDRLHALSQSRERV